MAKSEQQKYLKLRERYGNIRTLNYLLFFHRRLNIPISRKYYRLIHRIYPELENKLLEVLMVNKTTVPWITHNIQNKLAKQFKFNGFIPLKEFHKIRKGFSYITSNCFIEGDKYIYPTKLVDDFSKMKPSYNKWEEVFNQVSITGFTRINYSFDKITD